MGVRIIEGKEIAALYDSTSGVAFGPIFQGLDAHDQAVHFLDWTDGTAHRLSPRALGIVHKEWSERYLDAHHGELTAQASRRVVELL